MVIWLGFPEESAGEGGSGEDNVQTLIDEAQVANEQIDQLEDQLKVELQNSDSELKRTEKEEFVDDAELGEDVTVADDTMWPEIIDAYNKKWRTQSGPKKDALETRLRKIRGAMNNIWEYGNPEVLHGKLAVDRETRINDGYSGEVRTKINEIADKIIELNTKMNELSDALEQERSGGGGAGEGDGGESQSILEAVRNMKEIRIETVTNVVTDDSRRLVEHQIPGRAGIDSEVSASIIQDLGRKPEMLSFKGLLTARSDDRRDLHRKIETLKWFYKQRKPLFFSSTFVNKLETTKVVMEKLNFEENVESAYSVPFSCVLKEYNDIDWREPEDAESESLNRQTQHWSDYQALKAMVGYLDRYIEEGEEPTTDLVGRRLATFLIGMNGRVKHLAATGTLIERPGELGVAETGALNVTNLSWNADAARRDETLNITADVTGVEDDTDAIIEIYEYDADGSHDLITTINTKVKDSKIDVTWDYEYTEDTDEIPTAEESEKGYNPPEYFFVIEIEGQRFGEEQESELLEFKDFIELILYDGAGNPIPNVNYKIILPDESEREGTLDENGYSKEEDIPPGKVKVEWDLTGVALY